MARMMPNRLNRIHAEGVYAALGAIDQWMVSATAYVALRSGNDQLSSQILQQFWKSSEAASWMDGNSRYTEMFLPFHASIVEPLVEAAREIECKNLVEIGCGRGDVLRHFAARLPDLETIFGIDLNSALLERAKRITEDPRVQFVVGDAATLMDSLAKPQSVILTNGGVYEYWSQENLSAHFRSLATRSKLVVALVEPLGSGHQLDAETDSQPYGVETSLSHNYQHLLRNAGFEITFCEEIFAGSQRWVLLVGRTGQPALSPATEGRLNPQPVTSHQQKPDAGYQPNTGEQRPVTHAPKTP